MTAKYPLVPETSVTCGKMPSGDTKVGDCKAKCSLVPQKSVIYGNMPLSVVQKWVTSYSGSVLSAPRSLHVAGTAPRRHSALDAVLMT